MEKGAICSLKQYESSEKCEKYHQISFQDLLSGRTFLVPSAATKEKTSEQYYKPFPKSGCVDQDGNAVPTKSPKRKPNGFLFLNLRKGGGNLQGALWEMVSALPGESTMLNFGEWPNEGKECTLSQILQENVPVKYSLSARACQGILNRAEKRGKMLPSMLRDALMEVVGSDG